MGKNTFRPDMGSIVQSVYGNAAYAIATAILALIWNTYDTWGLRESMTPLETLLFNILLAVGLITVLYLVGRLLATIIRKERKQEMIEVIAKHLTKDVVVVDNHKFIDCFIEKCRIRYNGGMYSFKGTQVSDITFETQNPTVINTISLLKSLHYLDEDFSKEWRIVPGEYLTKGMPHIAKTKEDKPEKDEK